jgi:hypothetical protein
VWVARRGAFALGVTWRPFPSPPPGASVAAMERVRSEIYQGKRIVVVDGTDVAVDEYADVLRQGAVALAQEPERSVLLATVVTRARYAAGAAEHLKAYSRAIRPYVKASAVVGLSPLQRVIFTAIRPFLHASVRDFATLAEAREWLVRFGDGGT